MMRGIWIFAAGFVAVFSTAHAQPASQTHAKTEAAPKPAEPGEDVQRKLLEDAGKLIKSGNSAEAISTLDKVIGYYEAKYPEGKIRWYVARTQEETLANLVTAAADMDKGIDKRNAESVYATSWADAYDMKGYALGEIGDPDGAKKALEHATRLSPYNAQYLSELAYVYHSQKNWQKMLELFNQAADVAGFSLPDRKISDKTFAKRGAGYALVELGRLDEAENAYKECLVLDPNDTKAQKELDYVRAMKAKNNH